MKSIVALLTLFCLYQGLYAGSAGCPNKSWNRFSDTDRCFYISPGHETYETAKKFCESNNAHLVPPLTCDEHIDLREFLTIECSKCSKGEQCDDFWIGIESSNGSTWETAKGFEINNGRQCQRWAKGFPNAKEGNCVIMSLRGYRKRGVWRNTNCTRKFKFVCITCPNNFEYLPEIDECLKFFRVRTTWSKARMHCSTLKKGAQLLTIQSETKQEAVERYLQNHLAKPESKACDNGKCQSFGRVIWMGAQTKDPKNCQSLYIWKPVKAGAVPLYYTNFVPGVPNCGTTGENCLGIATAQSYNYQWQDMQCSDTFCYVCEF